MSPMQLRREEDHVYWLVMHVGTPALPFKVIVDTTSAMTTVEGYDPARSMSARTSGLTFVSERSCDRGKLVNDVACIGKVCARDATLGSVEESCMQSRVDGIASFAPNNPFAKQFTLCLGRTSGTIHFEINQAQMQFVPLVQSSQKFTVHVNSMFLGHTHMGVQQVAVVDTGSSFTYVNPHVHDLLKHAFDVVCLQPSLCQQQPGTKDDDLRDSVLCIAAPDEKWLDDHFPLLELEFANSAKLKIKPSSYFWHSNPAYCVGIFPLDDEEAVLGTNVLRDHVVAFDASAHRIGYVPASCDVQDVDTFVSTHVCLLAVVAILIVCVGYREAVRNRLRV